MSWYFITAGLVLYALDHAIRLLNTVATVVQVEDFSAAVKDASRTPSRTSTPSNSAHGFNQSPASPATANTSLLSGSATTSSTSDAALGVDITGVTKLSYTVKYHVKEGSRPMSHLMGQYVYINIPAISSLEWHPFTISSAPVDAVSTHHIKVMGGLHGNQWTAKLHLLALDLQHRERDIERTRVRERGVGLTSTERHDTQARIQHPIQNQNLFQNQNPMLNQNHTRGSESESKSGETEMGNLPLVSHQQQQLQQQSPRQLSLSTLQVNIDGPYGLSVVHELHKYSHILLIGGGIGVTPLHSCLRHLLLMKLCAPNGSFEGTEGGRGSGRGSGSGSGSGGQEEPLSFPFPAMESVKLLWSVRSIEEASLFADTVSHPSYLTLIVIVIPICCELCGYKLELCRTTIIIIIIHNNYDDDDKNVNHHYNSHTDNLSNNNKTIIM
jgi:FAD-binding domain